MAGKIFINYRRDDSSGTAGRVYDRLVQAFGRENVFMDVDHIPAGVDFVEHLDTQVAAADAILVVIGPHWTQAKDDEGRLRLHNPDDFVVIEIASALTRNIRVIPVLVDGARMPKADELPDKLKPLVRRNAVEVRNSQFGRDADALTAKVREAIKLPEPGAGSALRFVAVAAAIGLLAAGAAGYLVYARWPAPQVATHVPSPPTPPAKTGITGDEAAWLAADAESRLAAWQSYLAAFPQGAQAAAARQRIAAREADRQIRTFPGNKTGGVTWVAFAQGGSALLTNASHNEPAAVFKLMNVRTGVILRGYGNTPGVRGAPYTPDGKALVGYGASSELRFWDAAEPLRQWTHSVQGAGDWVNALAFSPDGTTYAVAGSSGVMIVRDARSGQDLVRVEGAKWLWNVIYSPNGELILYAGEDGIPRLWSIREGRVVRDLPGAKGRVVGLAFSPDGKTAYTSGDDGAIRVWEVASGKLLRAFTAHAGGTIAMTISPGGRYLVTGGVDQLVKVWDLQSNTEVLTLPGHTGNVWVAAVSPDGAMIASGGRDEAVRLWDISDLAAKEKAGK